MDDWKQVLIQAKQKKEEERIKKQQEEEAKLAAMPRWQRDLMKRKEASATGTEEPKKVVPKGSTFTRVPSDTSAPSAPSQKPFERKSSNSSVVSTTSNGASQTTTLLTSAPTSSNTTTTPPNSLLAKNPFSRNLSSDQTLSSQQQQPEKAYPKEVEQVLTMSIKDRIGNLAKRVQENPENLAPSLQRRSSVIDQNAGLPTTTAPTMTAPSLKPSAPSSTIPAKPEPAPTAAPKVVSVKAKFGEPAASNAPQKTLADMIGSLRPTKKISTQEAAPPEAEPVPDQDGSNSVSEEKEKEEEKIGGPNHNKAASNLSDSKESKPAPTPLRASNGLKDRIDKLFSAPDASASPKKVIDINREPVFIKEEPQKPTYDHSLSTKDAAQEIFGAYRKKSDGLSPSSSPISSPRRITHNQEEAHNGAGSINSSAPSHFHFNQDPQPTKASSPQPTVAEPILDSTHHKIENSPRASSPVEEAPKEILVQEEPVQEKNDKDDEPADQQGNSTPDEFSGDTSFGFDSEFIEGDDEQAADELSTKEAAEHEARETAEREQRENEERDRAMQEQKEREAAEQRLKEEQEAKERRDREDQARREKAEAERVQKEKEEKARQEQAERERQEREEKDRLEREENERKRAQEEKDRKDREEQQERLEKEQQEERLRQEKEEARKAKEEQDRKEQEEKAQREKEEKERLDQQEAAQYTKEDNGSNPDTPVSSGPDTPSSARSEDEDELKDDFKFKRSLKKSTLRKKRNVEEGDAEPRSLRKASISWSDMVNGGSLTQIAPPHYLPSSSESEDEPEEIKPKIEEKELSVPVHSSVSARYTRPQIEEPERNDAMPKNDESATFTSMNDNVATLLW